MKVDTTRFPNWLASMDPKEVPCRGCGRLVVWGVTRAGKKIVIDIPKDDGEISSEVYVSHWATCPEAEKFRKKE